jgi:hypothetical protein
MLNRPPRLPQVVMDVSALLTGDTAWEHEWTEDGYLLLTLPREPEQLAIRTGVRLLLDREAAEALLDALTAAYVPDATAPARLRSIPGGA